MDYPMTCFVPSLRLTVIRAHSARYARWNYDLHWELLMGVAGNRVVGVLALLLMLSLGTGLYLWWPKGGKLRQALTIKRGAKGTRLIFDLHRVTGIYGMAVLFILAFSGLSMVYEEEIVMPLVNFFSPIQQDPHDLHSTAMPGRRTITADQAVAAAKRIFPQAAPVRVMTPEDPIGVFLINLREAGDLNRTFPMTHVWVDQYSGKVLARRDPKTFSAGDIFLNILFALHNGEAFGWPGRILVFITGFAPSILFVTGIIQWSRKRRAR